MNDELFKQAKASYADGDYEGALNAFTSCLKDEEHPLAPGEEGLLYHQIGNCLVKLKNPSEAIQAYTQATGDASYDACGAVNYNLGMAYASLHDYDNAVKHFEISVSDARYESAYKAYVGMGNALLKLGKSAEAGVAFREAALDEANPDPTKPLMNLGICFMALDRPADAVSTYESALQFDMSPSFKNKLYANLGQAYVACGQMQKATAAFEQAIADQTYTLSASASVDYQRAVAAIAQGNTEVTQSINPLSGSADLSGLDVSVDGSHYDDQDSADMGDGAYYYGDPYGEGYGYAEADDRFFNASDEELEQWSRGLAKQDRKRRNVGLKVFLVIMIIILIVFGAAIVLYTQGYGYPTQEDVVAQMFADPEGSADEVFAEDADEEQVASMTDILVEDSGVQIDGVNQSMSSSTVYATATTEAGGEIQYEVTLVRDFIGWKVSDVELYFASQN